MVYWNGCVALFIGDYNNSEDISLSEIHNRTEIGSEEIR